MSKHEILIMFLGSVATYCFEMQKWAPLKANGQCFPILVFEKYAFFILLYFLILLVKQGAHLQCRVTLGPELRYNGWGNKAHEFVISETTFPLFYLLRHIVFFMFSHMIFLIFIYLFSIWNNCLHYLFQVYFFLGNILT